MNFQEEYKCVQRFYNATEVTYNEARAVLVICEWNVDIALELFSLYPREVWTALPDSWTLLLGSFHLNVRKKVLRDFVAYFPRDTFQECSHGLDEESRDYLAIISIRAFANSDHEAIQRDKFAQLLQLGKTELLPLFQKWAQSLKEMIKAPAENLEDGTTRESFKNLLNKTLPNVMAEANPVFCDIVEDVANLHLPLSDLGKQTALHIAAKLGDFDLLNNLLVCNAQFDAKDGDGNTALHAGASHPSIVWAFLSVAKKARTLVQFVQQVNNDGQTALHLCHNAESARLLVHVSPGSFFVVDEKGNSVLHREMDADMLKVLLDAASKAGKLEQFVQQVKKMGRTPLHYCNNAESARLLLHAAPSLVFIKDGNYENTALHQNANHPGVVQVLLSALKDAQQLKDFVQQVNWWNQTALHFCNNAESARLMLRVAPHLVFLKDKNGNTALHLNADNPDFVQVILSAIEDSKQLKEFVQQVNEEGQTALHLCDNALSARLLLRVAPASLFALDKEKNTALHLNVRDPSVVQYLLSAIEDPEQLEKFVRQVQSCRQTALHMCSNAESARLLLQVSPPLLFLVDNIGQTALHFYVFHQGMVLALLDAAREMGQLARLVEQVDSFGRTALYLCKNLENARLLLAASPRAASIQCNKGHIPLHVQAIRGRSDICRLFLGENDADVNAANSKGQTALHLACHYRRFEIVDLLLEHSANLLVRDNEQRNVLHYAYLRQHDDAVLDIPRFGYVDYDDSKQIPLILDLLFARGEANAVAELIAARDAIGRTALHYFAAGDDDSVDLANKLILAGVNAAAKDEQGDTAMHVACKNSELRVSLRLIQHWGLSIRMENRDGKTALDLLRDAYEKRQLRRASVRAGIVTLRLAARPRAAQCPWKRLPNELFRELCLFLV